jgi:hypothetical protein
MLSLNRPIAAFSLVFKGKFARSTMTSGRNFGTFDMIPPTQPARGGAALSPSLVPQVLFNGKPHTIYGSGDVTSRGNIT